jgi:hypothetical protein
MWVRSCPLTLSLCMSSSSNALSANIRKSAEHGFGSNAFFADATIVGHRSLLTAKGKKRQIDLTLDDYSDFLGTAHVAANASHCEIRTVKVGIDDVVRAPWKRDHVLCGRTICRDGAAFEEVAQQVETRGKREARRIT